MTGRLVISILLVALSPIVCLAIEYGDLIGRFTYGGDPPKRHPIQHRIPAITKPVFDESLLVGRDGGVANVVIELVPAAGSPLAIHPRYDRLAEYPSTTYVSDGQFVPRVASVRTNQTLAIVNCDPTCCNPGLHLVANAPHNPLLPASARYEVKLLSAERLPARISCNVNVWLNGFAVVRDHPYVATSGPDGRFRIRDLPAGRHTFRAWHERGGYVTEVSIGGEVQTWKLGRFELEIAPGQRQLGEVEIPAKGFIPR